MNNNKEDLYKKYISISNCHKQKMNDFNKESQSIQELNYLYKVHNIFNLENIVDNDKLFYQYIVDCIQPSARNSDICKCGGKIITYNNIDKCLDCNAIYPIFIVRNILNENKKCDTSRKNIHFRKKIEMLQGICDKIPSELCNFVFEKIKENQLSKEDINIYVIKNILKQYDKKKKYQYNQGTLIYLYSIITGNNIPKFSQAEELKMLKMFEQIHKPYNELKGDRKNFLGYDYILYKFLQMLKYKNFKDFIRLIKSNEKITDLDNIWKKICIKLDWKFYPSV